MYGGSLYGSLDGKEEQHFDMFNFLFGKNNGVLQYTEVYIKTHHCQFKRRKHHENMFLVDQLTITLSRSVDQRTCLQQLGRRHGSLSVLLPILEQFGLQVGVLSPLVASEFLLCH